MREREFFVRAIRLVRGFSRLAGLAQAHNRVAVEAFGEINRGADGNLLGIHLIGPDFKMGQFGLAIDRCECPIHRIRAVGDLDAPDARHVVARIEGKPFVSQIDFAIGVEVHGGARINVANVRQVSGHVAGGQIEGAAQGNGGMGEITADSVTTPDYFGGREIGANRT